MDELIKKVSRQTGLNESQSRIAVTTILDDLKEKLPLNMAMEIEVILGEPDFTVEEARMVGMYRIP